MELIYILLSRLGINVAPTILNNALRMFTIAEKKLSQASQLEEHRIENLTRKINNLNHQVSAAKANQKDAEERIKWISNKVEKIREFTI